MSSGTSVKNKMFPLFRIFLTFAFLLLLANITNAATRTWGTEYLDPISGSTCRRGDTLVFGIWYREVATCGVCPFCWDCDGAAVTGASCTVSGIGGSYTMNWNSGNSRYEYSTSSLPVGSYTATYTCSKSGYDSVTKTKTFDVAYRDSCADVYLDPWYDGAVQRELLTFGIWYNNCGGSPITGGTISCTVSIGNGVGGTYTMNYNSGNQRYEYQTTLPFGTYTATYSCTDSAAIYQSQTKTKSFNAVCGTACAWVGSSCAGRVSDFYTNIGPATVYYDTPVTCTSKMGRSTATASSMAFNWYKDSGAGYVSVQTDSYDCGGCCVACWCECGDITKTYSGAKNAGDRIRCDIHAEGWLTAAYMDTWCRDNVIIVSSIPTSVSISTSPATKNYGDNVVFSASYKDGRDSSEISGASCTATIDGNSYAMNAVATHYEYSTSSLSVGSHTWSAACSKTNYASSTSNSDTITINAIPTSASVSASPSSPQPVGTSTTFSCTYSDAIGGVSGATCTIDITGFGTGLGMTDAGGGSYTYTVSLPVGSYNPVKCTCSKTNYATSTSSSISYVINLIVTTLSASVTPATPQVYGTNIDFQCDYKTAVAPAPISGATCNVVIDGVNNPTNFEADNKYHNRTTTLPVGNHNWYCDCSKTNYEPKTTASQSYKILGYCNLAFIPSSNYVGTASLLVNVLVKLTNSTGGSVTNPVNMPTFFANFPTPPTSPSSTTLSGDTVTATFNPLTTVAGSYLLTATSPICEGGLNSPITISGLINVTHKGAVFFNVTYPNPNVPRTLKEGDKYNVTLTVVDEFGNVINSSYGGTPYTGLAGVYQDLQTTPPIPAPYSSTINPYECTGKSIGDGCPECNCTHQFTTSDEAVHTFTFLAYNKSILIGGSEYVVTMIKSLPYEIAIVGGNLVQNFYGGYDNLVIIEKLPPPPQNASILAVSVDPSEIKPNDGITINVTALYANGSIKTDDNNALQVWADPGSIPLASGNLAAGQRIFTLFPSGLTKAGIYTINVWETINNSIRGSAILFVSPGPLARIIIYAPPQASQYIPFTVTTNLTDAWGNTLTTYSGEVNFSSLDITAAPNPDLISPLDEGQASYEATATANNGIIPFTISALEPTSGSVISNTTSINIIKPLGCINYTISPATVGKPVYNSSIKETIYPPIQEVIDANNEIADYLIGWDNGIKEMKGNFTACADEFFSTTMCFTDTEVYFSRPPLLFCIKELTYTPSVDDTISDHYNYNGTGGNLLETFKYPQVLWAWGAASVSGGLPDKLNVPDEKSTCVGNDKYYVTVNPQKLTTKFFNLSAQMPAGIRLIPYNMTNDSVLDPHEIRGNEGLLVVDERNETVDQAGRLAKLNYSGNFYFQESYTNGMTYPQGVTSDLRGFIYVANNFTNDIKIFSLIPGKKPPLIKYVDGFQVSGYRPFGVATDSWSSLYVVGNTNPGAPNNKMRIDVYDKDGVLLTSNDPGIDAPYRTIYGVTVDSEGTVAYVGMDNETVLALNASNVSQSVGNFSIKLQNVVMMAGCFNTEITKAPPLSEQYCSEHLAELRCTNALCTGPVLSTDDVVKDHAKGLALKRGTIFVIDYIQYPVRWYWMCNPFICGGCGGCVPNPFGWDICNRCSFHDDFPTQKVMLTAWDVTTGTPQLLDNLTIEPPYTAVTAKNYLGGGLYSSLVNPVGDYNFKDKTYLTHGIDIVEDTAGNFELYIAINNASRVSNVNHSIVMFKFNTSSGDFMRDVAGNPVKRIITRNVSHPNDVLLYPDLVKTTLSRGIVCEGCTEKGQISPKIIQKGMELLNQTAGSPTPPVTGSGGFIATVKSNRTAVIERAYLNTNITGAAELTLDVKVEKEAGGCASPGTRATLSGFPKTYIQEAEAYSNNLNNTVEGGGLSFYLTKPSYFIKPKYPPNTLPYLAYNFFSTRFLAKHLALMNLVDNVMGAPASASWLLNSTYRINFTIIQNSFLDYQFVKTKLFLEDRVHSEDTDASKFLKAGQSINYNNTINWEFPYETDFEPITFIPNQLPYTPCPGLNTPWCIDSQVMVHVFIKCRYVNGSTAEFGAWTIPRQLINLGSCQTLEAISVSGAMAPTNATVFPCFQSGLACTPP